MELKQNAESLLAALEEAAVVKAAMALSQEESTLHISRKCFVDSHFFAFHSFHIPNVVDHSFSLCVSKYVIPFFTDMLATFFVRRFHFLWEFTLASVQLDAYESGLFGKKIQKHMAVIRKNEV